VIHWCRKNNGNLTTLGRKKGGTPLGKKGGTPPKFGKKERPL